MLFLSSLGKHFLSSSRAAVHYGIVFQIIVTLLLVAPISATLHVPSLFQSYLSIPAAYYGKPWTKNDNVAAYLQYLDLDWCTVADQMMSDYDDYNNNQNDIDHDENDDDLLLNKLQNSSSSSSSIGSSSSISISISKNWRDNSPILKNPSYPDLPIALLVNDKVRADGKGHYPCHLIDFENLASAWNVSYIIFYDGIDRPLSYTWTYLDDRVLSEKNEIRFQLVSYQTGMDLRALMMVEEQKSNNQTESTTTTTVQGHGGGEGIIINLDGRSGTKSGPRFDPRLVHRRKAIALIPKFTGLLSLLGSLYILCDILGWTWTSSNSNNNNASAVDRNEKLKTTFNRLLVGLSVADIMSSLAYVLSHWMFPAEASPGTDEEWYQVMFPYATGTQGTCAAQGFFIQLGQCSSILFTACISIQCVLRVRYRWTDSRMRKAEIGFFTIGILLPLAMAIASTSIGAMHPTGGGTCWIGADPYVCSDSYLGWCRHNKTWGEQMNEYKFYMGTLIIGLGLLTVLVSMILLFATARSQEQSASRWSSTAEQGRAQKAVLSSASLYLGAYILIYAIVVAAFLTTGAVNVILVIVLPSQGFLNAMIYSGKCKLIFKRCFRHRDKPATQPALGLYSMSLSDLSALHSSRIHVQSTTDRPATKLNNTTLPEKTPPDPSEPQTNNPA